MAVNKTGRTDRGHTQALDETLQSTANGDKVPSRTEDKDWTTLPRTKVKLSSQSATLRQIELVLGCPRDRPVTC